MLADTYIPVLILTHMLSTCISYCEPNRLYTIWNTLCRPLPDEDDDFEEPLLAVAGGERATYHAIHWLDIQKVCA